MIMGAGALGSLFGGLLSSHNEVTLVGRGQHIKAMRDNGLKIEGATLLHAWPRCVMNIEDIDKTSIPDIVILAVKAYDTEEAIEQCLPVIGQDTRIMTFQNGLGNVETIQKYVPDTNIIGGITSHGATRLDPGMIRHGGIGDTVIGHLSCDDDEKIRTLADIFTASGIITTISDDIGKEIWAKAIVNSAINPITALLGEPNGAILEDPELVDLVRKIVSEGVSVGNSIGMELIRDEIINMTLNIARRTAKNMSSMLQDVEATRRTEIDHINGVIVRMGLGKGIEAKLNNALLDAVKIREKGHIDKNILKKIALLTP